MRNAKHKYYSQNGEDFLLWELFGDRKTGFYVDVGAFDGVHLSNSYSFEQEGWKGICIEANPGYFDLCKENRPRSICINAACVAEGKEGFSDFYTDELGLFSGVTVKEENVLVNHYKSIGLDFRGFQKINVPAVSLNDILKQHVPSDTEIDFLSIDVEGSEIDILKGLDLRRFRPRVVILEANSEEERKALSSYMAASCGYIYARNISVNAFFVRDEVDAERLNQISVNCSIEPQKHPLGEKYTIYHFIKGKAVSSMKITVYITSYNQKEYLTEAIESVLAQSLRPHQIIIVDDCSTDGSRDIIARYADKYPSLIIPIYHDRNLGVVQSRIHALNSVTGDYVTYLDGDDRFLPTKLEKEAAMLLENPHAKIAFSNYHFISPEGSRIGTWAEGEKPPEGDVFCRVFAREFPKRNLFRNELVHYQSWKSIGFHDPHITIYEDFEMRIRLTKHMQTVYCDETLSEYRLHGSGLSRLKTEQHLASLDYLFNKNKVLLDDMGIPERNEIQRKFKEWLWAISGKALDGSREEYAKAESKEAYYRNRIKKVPYSHPENQDCGRGENLIFVISQPRAGSTLLQRILGGHPDVHTIAEPWIMLYPAYALKKKGITAEFDASHARDGLDDFLAQVPEGEELYIEALRKMGTYMYNRMLDHSGKYFFLDKTPRYYMIIPELYRIFPEARFVFILRNPVAVFSSLYNTWFRGKLQNLIDAPHYRDLMDGPRCLVEGIDHLKEKAIVVKYEDMVMEPEKVVLHVCSRIGVPYNDDMLEYGSRSAPRGRFGDAVGVKKHKRPVRSSVNKWLSELSEPEVFEFACEYISRIGTEVLSKMGYPESELKNEIEYFQLNRRGEQQFESGDEEGAMGTFRKASEMNLNFATADNNLGVLFWQRGDVKSAFRHFTNALKADPDDRATVLNCGNLLMHFRQFDDAKNLYLSFFSRHPDDRELWGIIQGLMKRENAVLENV